MESPDGSTRRNVPSRGSHRPTSHSSSLLEEVLAQKKMDLMRSPDVTRWLEKISGGDTTACQRIANISGTPTQSQENPQPSDEYRLVEVLDLEAAQDDSGMMISVIKDEKASRLNNDMSGMFGSDGHLEAAVLSDQQNTSYETNNTAYKHRDIGYERTNTTDGGPHVAYSLCKPQSRIYTENQNNALNFPQSEQTSSGYYLLSGNTESVDHSVTPNYISHGTVPSYTGSYGTSVCMAGGTSSYGNNTQSDYHGNIAKVLGADFITATSVNSASTTSVPQTGADINIHTNSSISSTPRQDFSNTHNQHSNQLVAQWLSSNPGMPRNQSKTDDRSNQNQ